MLQHMLRTCLVILIIFNTSLTWAQTEITLEDIWKNGWHTVLSKTWARAELQVVLEGRGMVIVVKHVLRSVCNFGLQHCMLGDSMGPLLAATKGRSSCPAVQRICRRLAALWLCSGAYGHWRLLPSDHNSADSGSR